MVGVGHRFADDRPGFVPAETVLVDEEAHQFGDRTARVSIVELKTVFGGKGGKILAVAAGPAGHGVLEAG